MLSPVEREWEIFRISRYITGVEGGIVVRGGEQHTVFTLHVKMGDIGGD